MTTTNEPDRITRARAFIEADLDGFRSDPGGALAYQNDWADPLTDDEAVALTNEYAYEWVPANEFGGEYMLPVVAGLADTSWHNDACPSLSASPELMDPTNGDTHDLRLWVEHADPDQREMDVRFVVNYQPWSNPSVEGVTVCDDGNLYEGDNLIEALAAFATARAAIESAIKNRATAADVSYLI